MAAGDVAAGVASLERATALDPRSAIVAENHAFVLLTAGRNAEARARCERALEMVPGFGPCLTDAAGAALQLGDYAAAREPDGAARGVDQPERQRAGPGADRGARRTRAIATHWRCATRRSRTTATSIRRAATP
jgi:tetratricopeptide (TPR) repeat protein